jgi:RND family efflux transporter MFP subunit
MSVITAEPQPRTGEGNRGISRDLDPAPRVRPRRRWRILPLLMTGVAVALAVVLGRTMWAAYMTAPWTRDGTVRAYVVTIAPEVPGRIVSLPVTDNQFVHKGDPLVVIDATDYTISVRLNEAAVQQAPATMQNAEQEAKRRLALPHGAASIEEQQTYETQSVTAQAHYQQALAYLDQARVNLRRTVIRSPVNGWVTNLLAQQGNYATVGQNVISVTDADSFWVDGYFEESNLDQIHVGDPAEIKLMAYRQILHSHVASVARAINVANAQPNGQGVATVGPIFTWVRLAQRIPVRLHFDRVPQNVALVAGMTGTVQIDPGPDSGANTMTGQKLWMQARGIVSFAWPLDGIPDRSRRTSIPNTQPPEVELPLAGAQWRFDAGYGDRRGIKSLEPSMGPVRDVTPRRFCSIGLFNYFDERRFARLEVPPESCYLSGNRVSEEAGWSCGNCGISEPWWRAAASPRQLSS